MKTEFFDCVEVKLDDTWFALTKVTYYPPYHGSDIDPPEGSFIDYEEILVGDYPIRDYLSDGVIDSLEYKAIQMIEG